MIVKRMALLTACLMVSVNAAPTVQGGSIDLSAYRGKVVLLNFWATTCGGCKVEIPWFMEFARRYKHRGLAVIGVSLDDDGWKSVRPWIKARKLNYPVVIGNDALAKAYGAEELPKTFLIDRTGRVVAAHTGIIDKDDWEQRIGKLIQ